MKAVGLARPPHGGGMSAAGMEEAWDCARKLFVLFDRLKEAGDAAGLLTAANGATLLRMPDKLVETCEAMQ